MSSVPKIRGFTLMEILTVMAIVTLLTGMTLAALRGVRERVLVGRARAELVLMAEALENYRRLYGDYPQTGDFAQAAPDLAEPLTIAHAQAKVFNALMGVFSPRAFAVADRINGFGFIDAAKFTLEFPPGEIFPASAADGRAKKEICTALLDPWGRRYLYYYKSASNPSAWSAGGYLLYSAGLDGMHVPPDAARGLFPSDSSAGRVNADNVQADALMR